MRILRSINVSWIMDPAQKMLALDSSQFRLKSAVLYRRIVRSSIAIWSRPTSALSLGLELKKLLIIPPSSMARLLAIMVKPPCLRRTPHTDRPSSVLIHHFNTRCPSSWHVSNPFVTTKHRTHAHVQLSSRKHNKGSIPPRSVNRMIIIPYQLERSHSMARLLHQKVPFPQ